MQQRTKSLTTLFFVKMFSSLCFAIIMSSLALYLNTELHHNEKQSAIIVGTFLALNYALPLIGGYIGNNYVSFKKLFCAGMVFQSFGLIGMGYFHVLGASLALILIGSMVGTVSIIVFISSLTGDDHDYKRKAMLWNYCGMNTGFLFGFFISGSFGLHASYQILFKIIAILPLLSMFLVNRYISYNSEHEGKKTFSILAISFIVLVTISAYLLAHAAISRYFLLLIPVLGIIYLTFLAFTKYENTERTKLLTFIFYMLLSIFFWSIYMLLPTVIMLFIKDNIHATVYGVQLAPQWFDLIDSIVLVLTPPLLAKLLSIAKEKYNYSPPTSVLFGLGLLFLAFASLIITDSSLPLIAIVSLYILLQSLGELFIGPEGYCLPGKLAPKGIREFTTGAWVSTLGIASLIATILSDHILENKHTVTLSTISHTYHTIFWVITTLCCITFLFGFRLDKKTLKLNAQPIANSA